MQPIKELLTPEEFRQVTQRSNWRGASIVGFDWLVIILTFVLLANYPNPVSLLIGLFVLGARQLGLGIIVHETGHQSLFNSSRLNDFASKWLSGYWVFSDRKSYMKTHLKHHQSAGTIDDPDAPNDQHMAGHERKNPNQIKPGVTEGGKNGEQRQVNADTTNHIFSNLRL